MTRHVIEVLSQGRVLRVLEPWSDGTFCVVVAEPGEDRWCYLFHVVMLDLASGAQVFAPADGAGELPLGVLEETVLGTSYDEELPEKLLAAFGVPWERLDTCAMEQLQLIVGMPRLLMDEVRRESAGELRQLRRFCGNDLPSAVLALRMVALYRTERMGMVGL